MRTLNLACGQRDNFGTDKLDWKSYGDKKIKIFDLNSRMPLPFKDNTFDEVRFWDALQFMIYPQDTLSECFRILKVDGVLDIMTPNSDSSYWVHIQKFKENQVKFVKQYHDNGHIYSIFNATMLLNRLKHERFKIETVTYIKKFRVFDALIRIKCTKPKS